MYRLGRSVSLFSSLRRPFASNHARSFSVSAPVLKFRRVSPSLPRDDENTVPKILQRVSYYVEEGFPHVALGYFNKKLSQEEKSSPNRSQLFEVVMDHFLRKKCFDEAEKVLSRLTKEGLLLSPPLQAKIISLQHVSKIITREAFLDALQKLFNTSVAQFTDPHFHDLIHHLMRAENSMELLEKVVEMYIRARGPGYWLDSVSVAYMISRHLTLDNRPAAEQWLDYHSRRLSSDYDSPDADLAFPYTAFIHSLIEAAPKEDPTHMYMPILDRMAHDGAWPDTVLINTLITAELQHGRADRALRLYDTLREHRARSVFPDETTFSQLFTAAGRLAQRARTFNTTFDFGLPSRTLFREMLELHKLAKTKDGPPVVSRASLGAALWQFVVSGDYAGACIALRMYLDLHVPFEENRVIKAVTTALIGRCRHEIMAPGNFTSWVDVFLNLRDVERTRLKRDESGETMRRMLDVAKHELAVMIGSSEAPKEKAKPPPPGTPVKEMKLQKMRLRRLQLVDTLLVRALAADIVVERWNGTPQTPAVLQGLAEEAIRKAEADMVPTDVQTDNGALPPRKLTTSATNASNIPNTLNSRATLTPPDPPAETIIEEDKRPPPTVNPQISRAHRSMQGR